MRVLPVILVLVAAAGSTARAQVEIDRTIQRVYGTAIMTSDIRQVRLLRLAPDAADDAAIQTAIENRLLMLREAARGAVAEPAGAQIAARRAAWTAAWPGGTDLPRLMERAGMTDKALDGWFRDTLLIEAYLEQRFGQAADPRRPERIAYWIRDLRHRANLPEKG